MMRGSVGDVVWCEMHEPGLGDLHCVVTNEQVRAHAQMLVNRDARQPRGWRVKGRAGKACGGTRRKPRSNERCDVCLGTGIE